CTMLHHMIAETDQYPFKGAPLPFKQLNTALGFVTSTDGGKTLSPFTTITQISNRKVTPSATEPQIAIDRSTTAFHDRMYVVYEDLKTERTEVFLVYSTDRGKTWSTPVTVSDDRTAPGINKAPWQTMPHIAVTPDGIVGVIWYDRRDDS